VNPSFLIRELRPSQQSFRLLIVASFEKAILRKKENTEKEQLFVVLVSERWKAMVK